LGLKLTHLLTHKTACTKFKTLLHIHACIFKDDGICHVLCLFDYTLFRKKPVINNPSYCIRTSFLKKISQVTGIICKPSPTQKNNNNNNKQFMWCLFLHLKFFYLNYFLIIFIYADIKINFKK
jgi:hypothetical protein